MDETNRSTLSALKAGSSPIPADIAMKAILDTVRGTASTFSLPIEMILRWKFSTRYFLPPTFVGAWVNMQWGQVLSFLVTIASKAIPGVSPVSGLISMSTLLWCFYGGCLWHSYRCWRLVVHPDLELDSEWEGEPSLLFLFKTLPHGGSWAYQRIVYEPAFVMTLTILLYKFDILTGVAALYLGLAAISLFVKALLTYYTGWQYIRIGMDMTERSKIIKMIGLGKIKAQKVGNVVTDSVQSLSQEAQEAVFRHASGLTPELEALLSKKPKDDLSVPASA